MIDTFMQDAVRYGGTRALRRWEHRERIRSFRHRQGELASVGFMNLFFFAIVSYALEPNWALEIIRLVYLALSITAFNIAIREIARMKATGRYWQTNGSIERIGF
jgi:hypothetical protein